MPQIRSAHLRAWASVLLQQLGTPRVAASEVADSLVLANEVGHDSHGVIRLLEYATWVPKGLVDPGAQPKLEELSPALGRVDGAWGWGQPACRLAVTTLSDMTLQQGIGAVTVRRCNHVGRIGEYAESLAQAGLVGLVTCNSDPLVAPFGGTQRLLGTNPLAISAPGPSGDHVVMDFATSAVAEGKLRVCRSSGSAAPPGALIDATGQPSTNPADFYDGGALLTFGGHKGYALSAMIELLGGALSGNHPSATPAYERGNGVLMIALNPEALVPEGTFAPDVRSFVSTVRGSRPAGDGLAVLLPGDVERRFQHSHDGVVTIGEGLWTQLCELEHQVGLSPSVAVTHLGTYICGS